MKKTYLLLATLAILASCKKSQQEDLARDVLYSVAVDPGDTCMVVCLVKGKLDSTVIVNNLTEIQTRTQSAEFIAGARNKWLRYSGFTYRFTGTKGDSLFLRTYKFSKRRNYCSTNISTVKEGDLGNKAYYDLIDQKYNGYGTALRDDITKKIIYPYPVSTSSGTLK